MVDKLSPNVRAPSQRGHLRALTGAGSSAPGASGASTNALDLALRISRLSVSRHTRCFQHQRFSFSFMAGIETGRVEARGLHGVILYFFIFLYCHVIGVVFQIWL